MALQNARHELPPLRHLGFLQCQIGLAAQVEEYQQRLGTGASVVVRCGIGSDGDVYATACLCTCALLWNTFWASSIMPSLSSPLKKKQSDLCCGIVCGALH